jgi:hypothetical protein
MTEMNTRKRLAVLSIAVLSSALMTVPAAMAETFNFSSSPLTNLNPASATINGGFTKFPTGKGLYITQCIQPVGTARPAICSDSVQVWVSDSAPAPAVKSTSAITIKPTALISGRTGTADCTKVSCGLFFRVDHIGPTDTSEDKFLPITFTAGAVGPALPADSFTVTANGAPLVRNVPSNLTYRSEVKIVATARSGLTPVITSSTPDCVFRNGSITALKGTGICAIDVRTQGNATVAPTSANYPFIVDLGIQTIPTFALTLKPGTKVNLPSQTSFGQPVTYRAAGKNCRVVKATLEGIKSGSCRIVATASAKPGLWKAFVDNYAVKIG